MNAIVQAVEDIPNLEQLQDDLSKTKILMMYHENTVFISSICFALEHIFTYEVATAATNGTYIKYNPKLFDSFNDDYKLFVVLHETWHVALGHCIQDSDRFDGYDNEKLNIAMDYVINNMLDSNGIQMPDWVCMDHKYDGMSVEQVYHLLPDDEVQQQASASMAMGGDVEFFKGTPEEKEEAQGKLDDMLVQASLQAEMKNEDPGCIPAEIRVRIEALTNPKLPWHVILRRYFTSMAKNDYSFRRPNRRYMPEFYLPSPYSEALGDIAMAIDMSGSVSDAETKQFISDVYSVLATIKLASLKLVQFDTRVFAEDKISTSHELMKIEFRGRGGTDVTPVIEWANENKPKVLVVFSDGYFCDPEINCDIPVIWVINNNEEFTVPYGKVIHYKI